MQWSAKRTAAIGAATAALLLSGVSLASADETGESNGSIGSGNNVDLHLLNNITACNGAGGGLLGFAFAAGTCDVENKYSAWDGGEDVTGDSNGSILSGNIVDANALNNVTVCNIAVAIAAAGAGAFGLCDVDNHFVDAD